MIAIKLKDETTKATAPPLDRRASTGSKAATLASVVPRIAAFQSRNIVRGMAEPTLIAVLVFFRSPKHSTPSAGDELSDRNTFVRIFRRRHILYHPTGKPRTGRYCGTPTTAPRRESLRSPGECPDAADSLGLLVGVRLPGDLQIGQRVRRRERCSPSSPIHHWQNTSAIQLPRQIGPTGSMLVHH
mmetsp:Transcript_7745/g.34394  ORF Transcript_7745/g.34394 Transcript_7745/m.34394 type:complete len:186 (+) Transcript_7745:2930-3487(+)